MTIVLVPGISHAQAQAVACNVVMQDLAKAGLGGANVSVFDADVTYEGTGAEACSLPPPSG